MGWWSLRGNHRLKPEAAGRKPLSFKTKMDGIMERLIGIIPERLRRNADGKNAGLLALVLVLSLALFFFISVRLSKLAARPLEKAVAMERQFVADISHDLKTPVTVILANSSILRESPDSKVSEQLQWIDSTDTAAKNMMELVSEMLTLSSLESPGRTVKKSR